MIATLIVPEFAGILFAAFAIGIFAIIALNHPRL